MTIIRFIPRQLPHLFSMFTDIIGKQRFHCERAFKLGMNMVF